MPPQTPTYTPPAAAPTTTPTATLPTLIPLDTLPLVVGALAAVALLAVLIYVVLRRVARHPFASKVGEWLTSPSTDVLVLGIDPYTREAKLFPCKRVGSIYISLDELMYVIPVGEGENYVLAGAGKPLIVALKYSRYGVQWVPALTQVVSLSLTPILQERRDAEGVREVMDRMITEITGKVSQVTGEVRVSPDITVYVTTNVPKVLEEFMKYVSYAVSAEASVISASIHTVEAEGTRILESQTRLVISKRTSLIVGVSIVVIVAAVAAVLLKMAGIL